MSAREFLLLRFDAPLMSFGGVRVDQRGATLEFPGRAMLTGLLGNALGWTHRDAERLNGLQERLEYGVRRDREGRRLTDFQTVDLSQDFLLEGWTTRGAPEGRGGGSARMGTHLRYRDFWADAVYTVALALTGPAGSPGIDELEVALAEPARPLFLGRKPCLPSRPLLLAPPRVRADNPGEALLAAPRDPRADAPEALKVWWPLDEVRPPQAGEGRALPVVDDRDWSNQIHAGRRFLWEGWMTVPLAEGGHA